MQSFIELRKSLEEGLPILIPRHDLKRYGWPFTAAHIANCDSQGRGPAGAIVVGRRVCYSRASLIEWLLARSTAKAR